MEKHQSLKWLIKFWASLAFFYWLHETQWVRENILDPFALATAYAARAVLPRIGMDVSQTGAMITTDNSSFEIAGSCTGTLVVFLYAAAVLSFPVSWKSRLKGLLAGFAVISILNFIRTLFIVVITSKFPGTFWLLHVVIGQAVVIVGTVGIYLWWIHNQDRVSFLPKGKRQAWRTTGMFLLGFVGGYAIYYLVFLKSSAGLFTRELIGAHTAVILKLFFDTTYHGKVLTAANHAIELAPACLSSPIVVIFSAVAMALPIKLWKKLAIVIVGFWPLFYLYHVIATTFIVVSIVQGASTRNSLIYNHFSQVVTVILLMMIVAYYDWADKNMKRFGGCVVRLAGATLVLLPLSIAMGALYRAYVVPAITQWISGSPELFFAGVHTQTSHLFNLTNTLNHMFDFQSCILLLLFFLDPVFDLREKAAGAAIGIPCILANCFITIAFIETFRLTPNAFLLQTWIVVLPFAGIYAVKWFKSRKPLPEVESPT